MTDKTKQIIDDILMEELFALEEEIVPSAKLHDDLNMDSIDCVEIIMDLEHELAIHISDQESEKVVTVQDVYDLVERNTK